MWDLVILKIITILYLLIKKALIRTQNVLPNNASEPKNSNSASTIKTVVAPAIWAIERLLNGNSTTATQAIHDNVNNV